MHVGRLEESEQAENYEQIKSRTGVNRMVSASRTKPRRPRATMRERQRMAQVSLKDSLYQLVIDLSLISQSWILFRHLDF